MPMINPGFKRYSWCVFRLLTLLLIVVPGLAHAFFGPPVLAAELHYQVFAENSDEIPALAFDGNDDRSPQSAIIGADGAC